MNETDSVKKIRVDFSDEDYLEVHAVEYTEANLERQREKLRHTGSDYSGWSVRLSKEGPSFSMALVKRDVKYEREIQQLAFELVQEHWSNLKDFDTIDARELVWSE